MEFFTADLCDKYQDGVEVFKPKFNSYGGIKKFFGRVATCKLQDNNLELIKLLKTKGNGRVCVVDVEERYLAVVGDKLMSFALENGWSGIVVNGYVRDTETTKNFKVGLLAVGTCPKKAYHQNSGKLGVDLNIDGIKICEGDYIYVDSDGVVISKEQLSM